MGIDKYYKSNQYNFGWQAKQKDDTIGQQYGVITNSLPLHQPALTIEHMPVMNGRLIGFERRTEKV